MKRDRRNVDRGRGGGNRGMGFRFRFFFYPLAPTHARCEGKASSDFLCAPLILAFFLMAWGCDQPQEETASPSPATKAQPAQPSDPDAKTEGAVANVLAKHRSALMRVPGVEGVGAGSCPGDPKAICILVYVQGTSIPEDLPQRIEGYPIISRPMGSEFRPQSR